MSTDYRALLHRIELLEATQHAHLDTSRMSETERERIRQELSQPAALQPHQDKMDRLIALDAADDGEPIVMPSVKDSLTVPAGSPVERVGNRMPLLPDGRVDGASARAAILEVAAWLVEQAPEPGTVGKLLGQISTPFAVMADILRDEANR